MSLLERFRAISEAVPETRPARPWEHLAKAQKPAVVGEGSSGEVSDIERILTLPRRTPPSEEEQAKMARMMTARLRRHNPSCDCAELQPEVVARGQNPCIMDLWPLQGWYLFEAAEMGGVLGPISVGGGKTGIDILTAMVVPGCRTAVLLIPSSLRQQFQRDYLVWSQHFEVPTLVGGVGPFASGKPLLDVVTYSELSIERNAVWLKARRPDVIIADEVQALKDRSSTRTSRFLRYFAECPDTKFFCHSGSMTTRSVRDYVHLSALSLKDGSPTPLDPGVADAWAEVLDPVVGPPAEPGELRRLCRMGESVRRGFHRRLVETKGVVATADTRIATGLRFSTRVPPPIPAAVEEALKKVRRDEQRPDGEELIDALEIATCARQVAAGFYLYWAYPLGEPQDLIEEWFRRRQAWNKALRERLRHRSDHLDSPKLLRDAAVRGHEGYSGDLPVWRSPAWAPWAEVADLVQPVTRVKWISDWLMRDAAEWGAKRPGIIWYENSAVGQEVARIGGFTLYGSGPEAADGIAREVGNRTIVASIKAHGTGRNLQNFSRNLFLQLPSDGGTYEQTLGRTHRPRQPAEFVTAVFYQHTEEYRGALEKATEYARYTRDTMGVAQKLLYGRWEKAEHT